MAATSRKAAMADVQPDTVSDMAGAAHLRSLAKRRGDLADMVNATVSGLVLVLAVCAAGQFLASATGLMPWLNIAASFDGGAVTDLGPWLQGGFAAIALVLALYLPAHSRVSRLERSHRNFQISMQDVAHAYRIAHEADRAGVFALSGEFDAMRERIAWLRSHPDLPALEPELLELAAQMSLQSRDLSRIYSDARVNRARDTLRARQQETDRLDAQIKLARKTCDEIGHWLTDVEAEERRVTREFQLLERDLVAVLAALGYELEEPQAPVTPKRPTSKAAKGSNVVALPGPNDPPAR
ncbi:DNA repair protein [Thioclava kandeliae]|uniref:DNA repair protein n=1 Tax=Thioclava kandeliae TaxID=3070818 RepID=A0ABV1SBQ1_9RHOB